MKQIKIDNKIFGFFSNRELFDNKITLLSFKKKFKENGIIFYPIFENELYDKKEILRSKIDYLIRRKPLIKINGRDCKIIKTSKNEKNHFLNKYHIQGTTKSKISYGAFHKNELVGVMVFDNQRIMNNHNNPNTYELTRFATKSNYLVRGIGSKLLKAFINEYIPNKIISFADRRWTEKTNNLYLTMGFKLEKIINPNYSIVNLQSNKRYHRFGIKSKIKKQYPNTDISQTESSLLEKHGYKKIWDCGQFRFGMTVKNKKIVFGFLYKITNTINGKVYIGQTVRELNKRISEYKKYILDHYKGSNPYLENTFNKYGINKFNFEIIDTGINIDELNNKEIFYINKYQSTDKTKGYNIESGGKNSKPSEDTLSKMSIAHKGIKQTDHWISNRVAKAGTEEAKKYGKPKTIEEREYLSKHSPKFWQGKSRDEKTKIKISQTKKERGMSSKTKKALCKKVVRININNGEKSIYESTTDAARQNNNISQSSISRRCNEKINNSGKYVWKFL